MRIETALTVCQCGHEKAIHHDELGCCSCECRTFMLLGPVICMVCGERFEDREKGEVHFAEYELRKK